MDLILFCVKTYNTEEAARAIQPIVGPQTIVLSLQNGIDAAERIGNVVGLEHLLGGVTWLSSAVEAPGVIRQVSQFRRIAFGELDGGKSKRMEWISEAFSEPGITVEASENIQKVLWTKLVFIAAISSLGSLTRLPLGGYRSIPQTRSLFTQYHEGSGGRGTGTECAVGWRLIERWLEFIDNSAPQIKPSMQLDISPATVRKVNG